MNKILLIVYALLLISCKKEETPVADTDAIITSWLDDAGISTASRDDSGIYYYPEATNPAGALVSSGNVVAIYYSLFNLDNTLIASHQSSDGDSLIFKHGVAAVYPLGLDIGVGYMRLGETYSFLLPPVMAFGGLTSGALEEDQIYRLVVNVVALHNENDLFAQELLNIQQYIDDNMLDDLTLNPLDPTDFFPSGIAYKRLIAGNGTLPLIEDTIIVNYYGRFLDDSGFDSRSGFEWIYGSNSPRELLSGFEFGVSLMQTGERALLFIPSSEAYRESALVIPQYIAGDLIEDDIIPDYVGRVPAYKTLIFDITRVD